MVLNGVLAGVRHRPVLRIYLMTEIFWHPHPGWESQSPEWKSRLNGASLHYRPVGGGMEPRRAHRAPGSCLTANDPPRHRLFDRDHSRTARLLQIRAAPGGSSKT